MLLVGSMGRAGVPADGTGGGDPRLKPAAHAFEASLMKEFLAPLEKDSLPGEDPGSDGEGSGSALMSFGAEALARAISERGGFGIATEILQHVRNGKVLPKENAAGERMRLHSRF